MHRIPVILKNFEEITTWLRGPQQKIDLFLTKRSQDPKENKGQKDFDLSLVEVGPFVNNSRNNSKECIIEKGKPLPKETKFNTLEKFFFSVEKKEGKDSKEDTITSSEKKRKENPVQLEEEEQLTQLQKKARKMN